MNGPLHASAARALSLLFVLVACEGSRGRTPKPAARAEFGIFYGGQVQQRDELPLELDPARQQQGFRLTLPEAPSTALEVRWELGKPGAGRRVTDSAGRKARSRPVQLGRDHFRPGEPVFEHRIAFAPGDPLGLWNVRVLLESEVVLERPFLVFDPAQRARQRAAMAEADAGL